MVPQDALAAVSNKCLRCLGRSSGKRRCAVALRRSPDATVTHDLHVHTRVSRLSSQSTEATSHCSRRKLAAARSSSVVANRISSSPSCATSAVLPSRRLASARLSAILNGAGAGGARVPSASSALSASSQSLMQSCSRSVPPASMWHMARLERRPGSASAPLASESAA